MCVGMKLVSSVWKRNYELSVGIRVNDCARSKCADDQNRKLTRGTTVRRADGSFDDAGGQLARQHPRNDEHRCQQMSRALRAPAAGNLHSPMIRPAFFAGVTK